MTDDTDPPLSPVERFLLDQASKILFLAVAEKKNEAGLEIALAINAHGWDAIQSFTQAWPALMLELTAHVTEANEPGIKMIGSITGNVSEIDDVPPAVRWAARWLQAYRTDDVANLSALWGLLPDAPWAELDALLFTCAEALRRSGPPPGKHWQPPAETS